MSEEEQSARSVAKVLLITRNMPPERGGMQRLNLHLALELLKEYSVAVVGPRGCRAVLPAELKVDEVRSRPLLAFFWGAFWQGISMSRRFRPDVVVAGSGLAAPFAWVAAKIVGAKTVVYVHGLDLIAESVIYRWFWRPFIRRADLCIANSRNTAKLAQAIGVPSLHICIVHPGVEMPEPPIAGENKFRERFDLGDRPVLLSVGRLIARKGLLEFVENALPCIVDAFPDVCLLILGDEEPDLLNGTSAGLGERIRQRATMLGLAKNLRFIGPQDDAALAHAYDAADIHIFPVREVKGDVEGFGMVALEAAAHGLCTVAFAVGGVPDAVKEGVSGYLVEKDDYDALTRAIIEHMRERGAVSARTSCRKFARSLRWESFGEQIRKGIKRL
jgi:phosphatidyl-myo-inositol dimannoside synthase